LSAWSTRRRYTALQVGTTGASGPPAEEETRVGLNRSSYKLTDMVIVSMLLV